MLETIHEYALEKLDESGEAEVICQRHAKYYLARGEIEGPRLVDWLGRLSAELDNLRAVVRWAVETGNAELGLRFGSAVERFLEVRGHLDEGQRWLDSVLAIDAAAPAAVRARALYVAGTLARGRGQYARRNACHQESLELYRTMACRWR